MFKIFGYGDTIKSDLNGKVKNIEAITEDDKIIKETYNRVFKNLAENDEIQYLSLQEFVKLSLFNKENYGVFEDALDEFSLNEDNFFEKDNKVFATLPTGMAIVSSEGNSFSNENILFVNKTNKEELKRQLEEILFIDFPTDKNFVNVKEKNGKIKIHIRLKRKRFSVYDDWFFGCVDKDGFENNSLDGDFSVNVLYNIIKYNEPNNELFKRLSEYQNTNNVLFEELRIEWFNFEPTFEIDKSKTYYWVIDKTKNEFSVITDESYSSDLHFKLNSFKYTDTEITIYNDHDKFHPMGIDIDNAVDKEVLKKVGKTWKVSKIKAEDVRSEGNFTDDEYIFENDLTINKDVLVKNDLTINKNVLVKNDLKINKTLTIEESGELVVNSISIFNDDIKILNDNFNINNKFKINNSGLTIDYETTFNDISHFKENVNFEKDVSISGNLTVLGDATEIKTTDLKISDNLITINEGFDGDPSEPLLKSGIEIERGTGSNYYFRYHEITGERGSFRIGKKGEEQSVATRDDFENIDDGDLLYWNSSEWRLDKSNLNYDGQNKLTINNTLGVENLEDIQIIKRNNNNFIKFHETGNISINKEDADDSMFSINGTVNIYDSLTVQRKDYNVQEVGPSGGTIVYYDSNENVYYEAFIEDTIKTGEWGNSGTLVGVFGNEIGDGYENTKTALDNETWESDTSFGYVESFNKTVLNKTYDDWFLPSPKEAEELVNVIGSDLEDKFIWTSREMNSSDAYYYRYPNGIGDAKKNNLYLIIPIRRFSPLSINSKGALGIYNDNPQAPLDVHGDMLISGRLNGVHFGYEGTNILKVSRGSTSLKVGTEEKVGNLHIHSNDNNEKKLILTGSTTLVEGLMLNRELFEHGSDEFHNSPGVKKTITHNLKDVDSGSDYTVMITPTGDAQGHLGEYWVVKNVSSFDVYKTGNADNVDFDWYVMRKFND